MITFLLRALIFLGSAFIGLVVADLLLPGFSLHWNDWWGVLLAPWLFKITRRHANALLGGIGLLSTFVALLIAVVIPAAGIGIDGPVAWIIGTLIVWLVTALATWLLPPLFLKQKVDDRRDA